MATEQARLVGRNIRRAREEAGLNQRQLADRLGADAAASNQHISNWERGVNKPSDRYLERIAKALDRDVAWFYEDHDRPADAGDLMGEFKRAEESDGLGPLVRYVAEQVKLLKEQNDRIEEGLRDLQRGERKRGGAAE